MPIEIKYTPSLDAGTYEATVTAVEERINKDGNPYRWWEFTTDSGRAISAISSMNVGPRSKAGQWIATLLGRQPEQGESVEVVGRPCLIAVTINQDGFSEIASVAARIKPQRRANVTPAENAAVQHAMQEGDDLPF